MSREHFYYKTLQNTKFFLGNGLFLLSGTGFAYNITIIYLMLRGYYLF